jgi:hypothetical protein
MAVSSTASTAARRTAQISFGAKGDARAVRVSVPGRPSADDIAKIDKILINDVIKDLTGCACLSGVIDVIWEPRLEKMIEVKL